MRKKTQSVRSAGVSRRARPLRGLGVVWAVVLLARTALPGTAEKDLQNSVVNIITVYNEYDFYRPWQMKGKMTKSGSGCIVAGNRILTNAHVVADQTFIQVKRAGQADKFVARVEYVAHECDLAILRVDDTAFFQGAGPIPIGKLPQIREQVAVYGFPQGGTKIAITEGVVSRVENLYYSHSQAYLLCCQIDAPINPGSSGGPVISQGKIVGVAFQAGQGENVGYMVPAPVIEHFLRDVQDSTHEGFPDLGISFEKMENPDLRGVYGLAAKQSGVLVNRVFPLSPAHGVLRTGDVILSIDGFDVANDATVSFRTEDRTFFEYPAQCRSMGDSIPVKIWRAKKVETCRIRLSIASNAWQLVPRQQYDTPPRYYICGGFVFVPLTRNFLTTWGNEWPDKAPKNLVYYYFSDPDTAKKEIVLLGQILSDETNVGYDELSYTVVAEANGKRIADLRGLVDAIETNAGEYHRIVDEEGYQIVFSRQKALDQKASIFQRYKIVFDRSEDLRKEQGR